MPQKLPPTSAGTSSLSNDTTANSSDPNKEPKDVEPCIQLSPKQKDILESQVQFLPVQNRLNALLFYASVNDRIILAVAGLAAICSGATQPLMTILFGNLAGVFKDYFNGAITEAHFRSTLGTFSLNFIYLAIAQFVSTYINTVGFMYTGEHITQILREKYLEAVLRQNIAFFDTIGAGEITTRISSDTRVVQDGISQKSALFITSISSFITALIIAFVKYWKLTLILSSVIVFIALMIGIGTSMVIKCSKRSFEAYAVGGSIAQEAISSIREVTALGAQEVVAIKYYSHLTEAMKWGTKSKSAMGLMTGGVTGGLVLAYGLAFWLGARYYVAGEVNIAHILSVLLAILIGATSVGNVAPNAQAIVSASAASSKIISTIERVPPIDSASSDGKRLNDIQGKLEFKDVVHIYPSRINSMVMNGVSFIVPAGTTTAIVGASGAGKSSIVGLIERFYNPISGQIMLDNCDISELNLKWLRQQLSLVSQDPVLFNTTILHNIEMGLIGTKYEDESPTAKRDLVESAAKTANVHTFISSLPEGYSTKVGERGSLLSGGQRQRINIARAVVSNPKVLLLDEATSSLDPCAESAVQAGLSQASRGRTTIVIAHRLSTIRSADNIMVLSQGCVAEQGPHEALMEKRGPYYELVQRQRLRELAPEGTAAEGDLTQQINTPHGGNQISNEEKGQLFDQEDPEDRTAAEKFRLPEPSLSHKEEKQDVTRKGQKYTLWTLLKLIFSFNKHETGIMLVGLGCSIIAGGNSPVQAVFFAKSVVALSLPETETQKIYDEANFWALMYLMLGIVQILAYSGQGIAFAFCSERLICRARDRAFRALLHQDIAFFDREGNGSGALTMFLSTQITQLAGISGATLGTLLVTFTTLVSAIALSCAIGWKLALVCTSTVPILIACGYFRVAMLARFEAITRQSYESSAGYACEAINLIHTVVSLTREEDVLQTYHQSVILQTRKSLISSLRSSTLFAASQAVNFLCFGLTFWYGGTLMADGEYTELQFYICFSAVLYGALSAGVFFSFAPDIGRGKQASEELKKLFDRKPKIDWQSKDGDQINVMRGAIKFDNVEFCYDSRPDEPALRKLNFSVDAGQNVALVGASGSGKSTTISLLERFYDPQAGTISVDGIDISKLQLSGYRKFIALVSQDLMLFQGSIKENLLFGLEDDSIDQDTLIQACKDAHLHDFIISLPEGLDTSIGSSGHLLSGGQRQRLAIARALLRDPKILLLDEATSALDSASETIVQAALETVKKGRTTIAIAHRYSSIQNADRIFVFKAGEIVESGTHKELLAMKSEYFRLCTQKWADQSNGESYGRDQDAFRAY